MSRSITKMSDNQFRYIETIDFGTSYSLDFIFTINIFPNYRNAFITLIGIEGLATTKNDLSVSVSWKYNSDANYTSLLSNVTLPTGEIDKSFSPSFTPNYDDYGLLNLSIKFGIGAVIAGRYNINTVISDFYSQEFSSLDIEQRYENPEIEITGITGTLNYNGSNYLNLGSSISVVYSDNAKYNYCNSNSYVGFKFVKSGYSDVIIKSKEISDSGNLARISAIVDETYYEQLDNCLVYVVAYREDSKGNSAIDTRYIGKFYIYPKLINCKLSLSSSVLSYDISSKGGTCIFFDNSDTPTLTINYDKVLGKLSGYNVKINTYYPNGNPKYGYETRYYTYNTPKINSSILDLAEKDSYMITVIPVIKSGDNKYYNSANTITSKKFKTLDYIKYQFTGQDEGNSSGSLIPYYWRPDNIINPSYSATINANTVLSHVKLLQDSSRINSIEIKLKLFLRGKKYIDIRTIYDEGYTTISNYETLSNLAKKEDEPYLLMVIITGTNDNSESFSSIQYVGRVLYQPIKSPLAISANYENKKLTIEIDNSNIIEHQYGILSCYRIRISTDKAAEVIQVLDTITETAKYEDTLIYKKLSSNTQYKIDVQYVYEENGTYYEGPVFSYYQTFIGISSAGVPEIAYPIVPAPDEDIWYSLNLDRSTFVLFILPELIEGSGTATAEDKVYDDIRYSINNDITGDKAFYLSKQPSDDTTFLGTFKYKGKMLINISKNEAFIGECTEENKYVFRLQVHQNWNNVSEWGEIVEITMYGYKQDSEEIRQQDYKNNVITINRINDASNLIKGICKSYGNNSIDYHPYKSGDIIYEKDFIDLYNAYKNTYPKILTTWSKNKISRILEVNIPDLNLSEENSIITKDTCNYIEEEYNYLQETTIDIVDNDDFN